MFDIFQLFKYWSYILGTICVQ